MRFRAKYYLLVERPYIANEVKMPHGPLDRVEIACTAAMTHRLDGSTVPSLDQELKHRPAE